jgi:phosphoglycolate phosphatase
VLSRPSHIIFDLDGTLADSSPGILWSFRATLGHLQRDADEDVLRQLIGPPLGESFRILGVADEDIDDVVALYREFYAERGVYEARLYDGVASTLATLSNEGIPLAVATAKRVDFAHHMLDALGVGRYFDDIAGASMDLRVTSKFDIMDQVLRGWSIREYRAVWMVGDRHYDMEAARAHGVRAIGALWGFGSAEELRAAGAQGLISRPSELVVDGPSDKDAGSPVCLLPEVCDVCGAMLVGLHPTSCPRADEPTDAGGNGLSRGVCDEGP